MPDPDRPEVHLAFSLDTDGSTVTGSERVAFAPDVPTAGLVFRLVPNGAATAGNRLTVDRARGDDVTPGHYEPAAAASPGGLYVLPLTRRLRAGESTEVRLDFTLRLGAGTFERSAPRRASPGGAVEPPAGLGARHRLGPGPVRRSAGGDRH